MAHFLSLAISPQIHIGIDSEFNVVKNFEVVSKAKPSVFGYPEEVKHEEKKEKDKVSAAVLSSTTRMLAKKKSRLGTNTSYNTNMQIELDRAISSKKENTSGYKPIPNTDETGKKEENKDENKDGKMQIDDVVEDKEKKSKEKEKVEPEPEPEEVTLSNPCRILRRQRDVISFPDNQAFVQATPVLYNGLILLKKVKPEVKTEYFEIEKKVEDKDKKNEDNKDKKDKDKDKDGYKPVADNDDADMPDEFDIKVTDTK